MRVLRILRVLFGQALMVAKREILVAEHRGYYKRNGQEPYPRAKLRRLHVHLLSKMNDDMFWDEQAHKGGTRWR